MTPTRKKIIIGVSLLSLLGIGIGIASADDDVMPDGRKCPEGMKWSTRHGKCVVKTCPSGYKRNLQTGDCELIDDPSVIFIPEIQDPIVPGIIEVPDCSPGQHYDLIARTCVDDAPDEPGEDVDDIITVVPVGRYLYQVKKGDIFLGKKRNDGSSGLSICYMALLRFAHDAAMAIGGMNDAAAWQYVNARTSDIGHEIKNLRPYLTLITCSWWNDEAYASYRYAAGKATPGPQGRAISLNPAHAPNRNLLKTGSAPARNVRLGVPADKGKGSPTIANGSWRSYPLLQMPDIDLGAYWESGFNLSSIADPTAGLEWPGGSPRSVPPPWVQARGIVDASGTLRQGTVMGCGNSTRVIG